MVIAIIGLLASVILVSLNNSRTKAAIAAGQQFGSQLDRAYGAEAAGMWGLNEGSGGTVTNTVNKGVGTISAPYTWVSLPNGGAGLYLNGPSGGQVDLGKSTAFDSTTFTISFWIMANSFNSTDGRWYNTIMSREAYLSSGFRMAYDGGGRMYFWTTQDGGTIDVISTKNIGSDRFYHVALTYANGKATFYIDGRAAGAATGTYIVPTGQNLILNNYGGSPANSDATFYNLRFFTQSPLVGN